MTLRPPSFSGRSYFGVTDAARFISARDELFEVIKNKDSVFAGDNLITWGKTLGFMQEQAFVDAVNKHTRSGTERATVWRVATLVWAARQTQGLEGDFVECACYRGSSARIVADLVGLKGRRYFLYDLFDHDPSMPHHTMPEHSSTLYQEVCARFPEPEVIITQGLVPSSFDQAAPDKIAFMHLDLNNRDAEIGALEQFWDRITPGGVLVLDDFGWQGYRDQQVAEREWFGRRGYPILEMPTGQGLVIKRP
jgi:O-methyltransferase